MQGTILLNYGDNTKVIEDEEKTRFIRANLEQMGVPIQEFWDNDGPLSVEQKIKLRSLCSTYGIQVIDDHDGHLQIFVDRELVAEWQKCIYKLKRDPSELDPHKQFFLEMTINCWSAFEDQPDQET